MPCWLDALNAFSWAGLISMKRSGDCGLFTGGCRLPLRSRNTHSRPDCCGGRGRRSEAGKSARWLGYRTHAAGHRRARGGRRQCRWRACPHRLGCIPVRAARLIAEDGKFDGFANAASGDELDSFFRDDLAKRESGWLRRPYSPPALERSTVGWSRVNAIEIRHQFRSARVEPAARCGCFDRKTHLDVGGAEFVAGEPAALAEFGFHEVEMPLDLRVDERSRHTLRMPLATGLTKNGIGPFARRLNTSFSNSGGIADPSA